MEQIIKAVMQQTGLSDAIAKQAVEIVLNQIKAQLPKPIADQIDGLLSGAAGGSADVVGSVMKGLGGMFGGGDK
jgi:ribosomal protein L7/L12